MATIRPARERRLLSASAYASAEMRGMAAVPP